MAEAIETAITAAVGDATGILTAGVAILAVFLTWRKIKKASSAV